MKNRLEEMRNLGRKTASSPRVQAEVKKGQIEAQKDINRIKSLSNIEPERFNKPVSI